MPRRKLNNVNVIGNSSYSVSSGKDKGTNSWNVSIQGISGTQYQEATVILNGDSDNNTGVVFTIT